uniref:Uncharacterized protein n=1 Tax=Medicago truncatula TaxID=3880 RepID=I3T0C6_MEDTR|nr:unknown [Medicago truncatula]
MEKMPALLMRACKGVARAFQASANLATESNERRSTSITSTFSAIPNPNPSDSICHLWIKSLARFVFLTAITTCAPDSANCLAISRPMPLVEPVTIQVRSLIGGNGIGLCK